MLHSPSLRSWFKWALPKQLQELSRDVVNVRIWFFLCFVVLHLYILKADKEAIRAALDGTPVENKCPIEDETFVACCGPREDSTRKSSSLLPGLCSATKYVKTSTLSFTFSSSTLADISFIKHSDKACDLWDESPNPQSLNNQQSLDASLDAGLQNGNSMYNRPPLGNQADGESQINDQSYLDSDKGSRQAFPGDFPVTIAQMTTGSLQHDGWDSLPPLANSGPIARGPYLQGSPYAQALAAAGTDSNTETDNDFTDWRFKT